MFSDRARRQIERLLDQAEEAIAQLAWGVVQDRAQAVLALDPENPDATNYLAAAQRALKDTAAETGIKTLVPKVTVERVGSTKSGSFCDGRYQVIRFLGEGGKKRVYLCHDMKLDRDVAFALIKTEGLNAEGQTRIRREAQAMGKLGDHPHIVPVYDIGDESGEPYLVTQLMGGGDVEGLIEKAADHRLPLETVLRVGDEVCQALEYAHARGIVHRDLKPGNVWLTADGSAKLGDFGLAVALDQSRLTQAGVMVGTVSYMPPEQAIGGEVTPRSDLYSLGAMLYEMVCGRPPFVGDEAVAIVTQHLNTPPVIPSWHAPDVPPALEALILRLLEKDAGRRPASASETRELLKGVATMPGLRVETDMRDARTVERPLADPLYGRTFVGREHELRQLQHAFDVALSGQGSLAMVVGEPGIGKTSLCEQLATYVAVRGGRALVGHCYEEGSLSLPYLPFVEAMRSYVLAREPDGLRKDLGTGAAEVARLVSEIRDRLQVELRSAGDPEDDRWRLLQAVGGFLRNASTVQPLLLILEDLHDADRGTLDLLLHLSRNLEGGRLLIVGTYRDVEVDRNHPLSSALAELRRSGRFLRVPLRGLTVDEVQRMMSIVRGQEVPWSRAEVIHRQTEGNPLFVQEVLRYLVEEGIVVREGGRYLLSNTEAGIPEGLRDVVGKRLSRLSEKANQVLSVAAVIGREFRLDVLQQVSALPEDDLIGGLEEAQERAVIEERSAVGGALAFRFTHAFFRQTLYEEIFAARRIRWHQQVARALETVHARRLEEHAAELAEHFAQSTHESDLVKALHYSEMAAERARAVYAYGEAVRYFEQALKVQDVLDPDDKAKRCDLLIALGEALMPAGEPRRVADEVAPVTFEAAEAMADYHRAFKVSRLAQEALLRYGGSAVLPGPVFAQWAQRMSRYASPGTSEQIYADLALGRVGGRRAGSYIAARERALNLARKLNDVMAIYDLAVLELMAGELGRQDEQLRFADECRAQSREGVPTRPLANLLRYSQLAYLAAGRRRQAEEVWRELDELISRTRDAELLLLPLLLQTLLQTLDGELEAAIESGAQVAVRAEELGMAARGRLYARSISTAPLLYLGRAEDAGSLGAALVSDNAGIYDALCLAHAGRKGEARSALALIQPEIESPGLSRQTLLRATQLEIEILIGDNEAVDDLRSLLRGEVASYSFDFRLANVARQLAAAAVMLGDPITARAECARSLDWATAIHHRPEIALARLQTAEILLDHYPNEESEALEHLDFAIAEFRLMKMRPALERALRHKGLLKA
jgi:hypothetical protein